MFDLGWLRDRIWSRLIASIREIFYIWNFSTGYLMTSLATTGLTTRQGKTILFDLKFQNKGGNIIKFKGTCKKIEKLLRMQKVTHYWKSCSNLEKLLKSCRAESVCALCEQVCVFQQGNSNLLTNNNFNSLTVEELQASCPYTAQHLGCYRDDRHDRALPDLLCTERDESSDKYSNVSLVWATFGSDYLDDLVCRCSRNAP